MSKKPVFTSLDLNKLVDESIADADQFEDELKKLDETDVNFPIVTSEDDNDDYLPENDKSWGEKKNLINKETGESVSFNYVYKKIADLIDNGNAALQMLQSIDLDVADPQLLNASATLMNAIRGCIGEFTKIHQQWIRFNQVMKLEDKRLENKMKLIKYRNDVNNGVIETQVNKANELFEVKSADLVAFLKWKEEQDALEKEKEEKI